jgi:hypothetical protein
MVRFLVATLCCYSAITPTAWSQSSAAGSPPHGPAEWLPVVVNYVAFYQHAFYWQRLDAERGRLVMDVNGRNYEVTSGQPVVVAQSLPTSTLRCFPRHIDVAVDLFGLRRPKDDSPALTILERMADAGKDAAIEDLPFSSTTKFFFRGGSAIISLLQLYLSYTEAQRWDEAERIQSYLDTPPAEADIRALLLEFEERVRKIDPAIQRALQEVELAKRLNDGEPNSSKINEKNAKYAAELRLRHYGRPDCFADSH